MDGILYGTAAYGGAHGYGTIFSLNPATGQVAALYSFRGGRDGSNPAVGLCAYDGALYGLTDGNTGSPLIAATIFRFDPATGKKTTLHHLEFAYFSAAMTVKGNKLFGAYNQNGDPTYFASTLFRLNPTDGHVLTFPFPGTPQFPNAPGPDFGTTLLRVGNGLLGTTARDPITYVGHVFKFVP